MTGREEVMLARLPQLPHLGQTAVKPPLPPHTLLPHQQLPSIYPRHAPESSPWTKQSRHTSNKLSYSSRDSRPTTSASGHVSSWLDDSRPSAHLLYLLHLTRHWSAYSLSDVINRSNVRCSSNGSSSSSSSSSSNGSSEHKPSVLLEVLRGELDFYGNARRSISHIQRRANGNDRRQAENEDTSATLSCPLPSNASCPLLLSADRRKRHASPEMLGCRVADTFLSHCHLDVPRDVNQMSHLTPSPLKTARLVIQDNMTVDSRCRQQDDLVTQLPDYCTTLSRVGPVTISTDVGQGRTSVNVRDISGSVDKGEGYIGDDNAYKRSLPHPPASQMLAHCTTAARDKSKMSGSSSSLFEFSLDAETKSQGQLSSRGYSSEASPTSSLDEMLSTTDSNNSSRDEGTNHQLSPQDAVSISQHTSMQTQTRVAGWMVAIVRWAANQEDFCALPHTERRQLLHQAWSRLLLLHMTDCDFHFQVERSGFSFNKQATAEFAELVQKFISAGQSLDLDDTERYMMKLLVLYNPDCCGLTNACLIEDLNRRIRQSLLDHVRTNYASQPMRYNALLMRMRTLYSIDCSLIENLFCSNITLDNFTLGSPVADTPTSGSLSDDDVFLITN